MTHPHVLAIRAYEAAHPEVDWETHHVTMRVNRDVPGGLEAVGHALRDPEIEALMDKCCCHPWLPRHHGPLDEEPAPVAVPEPEGDQR